MQAQLVARSLSAGHGATSLFDGVDLVVAAGDVLGVVGPNGAGKSTLLQLLAGVVAPDSGSVAVTPPTATVGLLPQEPERIPGETVLGHLLRRTGVHAAQRALDDATHALADGVPEAADDYSTALQRWLALGATDIEERVAVALGDVGLDLDPTTPMTVLSGGEAARIGLAALLLSRFDVILLDEPTNDLDHQGLDQLERFVIEHRSAVVVISHDREFLARTVDRVLELDLHQGAVHLYGGGFDAYLVERERQRRQARDRYEDYSSTLEDLRARGRAQRAWADKGVRAARRRPADNDKFVTHHRVASSEQQAAKARRTDRMIERLDVVDEPRKEWDLALSIAPAPASGQVVASLSGAVVRRDGFVLGPVTLQIDRGDRVLLTGPNGSGKSTLLGLVLGQIRPDEGTAAVGASVQVGSIDQARSSFSGTDSALERLRTELPELTESERRTLVAKFGLGAEHVVRSCGSLSPGERTRAALAVLQARGVNLLVLDEPTNHLDLPAIEQLESAIDSFDATVLLVTHDRRMADGFRATRRLWVDRGEVTEE